MTRINPTEVKSRGIRRVTRRDLKARGANISAQGEKLSKSHRSATHLENAICTIPTLEYTRPLGHQDPYVTRTNHTCPQPARLLRGTSSISAHRVFSTPPTTPVIYKVYTTTTTTTTTAATAAHTRRRHHTMVDTTLLQTGLIIFGPLIYTRVRAILRSRNTSPIPLPSDARPITNTLFLVSLLFLLLSLPQFTPPNIFHLTSSRLLQTPTDTLFHRLSTLNRPESDLALDPALKSRLNTRDGRLLYASYGPYVLAECTWCSFDAPTSWLYYALPAILMPHVINLAVLGLCTGNRYARAWRTIATVAALSLAAVEVVLVYDPAINVAVKGQDDVTWSYWRARVFRYAGIAVLDACLAGVIWAGATKRWRVKEVEGEEAVERLVRTAKVLRGTGVAKGAAMGDAGLRLKVAGWWGEEQKARERVWGDKEVREVLQRRELGGLKQEAKKWAEEAVGIAIGMGGGSRPGQ
ncbi:hypothetical protein FPQ18DRAFT_415840 [Pyronema domesticum]|nr:hypothetical protein FPQ18DRAFT_415840 [Pyronema domesticum]